ncbi:MAG TPA: hypothetical protein VNW29_05880 [Candidatus Sulfotelmatobacter sp.]|nr:hypothetical protein [Candidatus Sulfotelmatobacter sp.]
MNVSKPSSKPLLLILIGVALVGIPITLYALQQQQLFKQFAFSTQQSAITECSLEDGSAVIKVTFANTESTKAITITANDLQTGTFVDLGTVSPQEIKSATIVTLKSSLTNGSVIFKLAATDGSSDTSQVAATYDPINNCSGPVANFCPVTGQNTQGLCKWDPIIGTQGYNVVITETDTGTIIQSLTVSKDASQSAFPMAPSIPYTCTVTPTNSCGTGIPVTSQAKICPVSPSPTPTPPPVCPSGTTTEGICRWDALDGATSYGIAVNDITTGQTVKTGTVQAPSTEFSFPNNGLDTYQCTVSSSNICGNTPPSNSPPSTCTVPTPTLSLTPTPTALVTPLLTPTPLPTSTPSPTPLPTATPTPLPTSTPQPTPLPTATPTPNPTPVIIVRTITQPPQQTVIQIPGQTQTIVQQGQTVVQPPAQSTPRPYSPVTPVPTVMPTGNTTPTFILVGTSAILLLAGGLIFFIL